MLILLSPAKNLNFEPVSAELQQTSPRLEKDTSVLLKRTKTLSRADLRTLMHISEDLADLNYERFQKLAKGLPVEDAKQAALAFNGDVYRGLGANSLSSEDLDWAQSNLRILSGLYGLLRPLDAIHPYRLEMGSKLSSRRGENLYDFWGDRITRLINDDLLAGGHKAVLNLASNEYYGAVKPRLLKTPVVSVAFKETSNGKSKIISFYAKYARGLMARWAIANRIDDIGDVKNFNEDGYQFQTEQSSEKLLVFTRPKPDPKS